LDVNAAARAGFHRLFMENQRRVFGCILSLLPRMADAEEVFQDACVIILSKADQFSPGTDFARWACQIARFEVYNYRRRGKSMNLWMNDSLVEELAETRLAESAWLEDRYTALRECLQRLRPADRSLIEARYVGKTTSRGLAQRLGMPENTVYKALGRIRRALGMCVDRRIAGEENQ